MGVEEMCLQVEREASLQTREMRDCAHTATAAPSTGEGVSGPPLSDLALLCFSSVTRVISIEIKYLN